MLLPVNVAFETDTPGPTSDAARLAALMPTAFKSVVVMPLATVAVAASAEEGETATPTPHNNMDTNTTFTTRFMPAARPLISSVPLKQIANRQTKRIRSHATGVDVGTGAALGS